MPNGFITIDVISTFPGMVMVVSLLTQFTKRTIDKLFGNRTEYVVYLYSLALCFFVSYYKGKLAHGLIVAIFLNLLNAVIVSLAAMKGYEKILSKVDYDQYSQKVLKHKL